MIVFTSKYVYMQTYVHTPHTLSRFIKICSRNYYFVYLLSSTLVKKKKKSKCRELRVRF